ncbi:MAG: TonB-dependent receptor [Breznakibacter sp.]|nr:TonB-dependent receptor [Breznakibacter sp.]
MEKRTFWVSVLLFICLQTAVSQSWQVSGRVISADDKEPLIGVAVVEKGTTNGIVTDFDGNYRLQLEGKEAIIVFSFMGMESVERIATPSNPLVDVVMSNSSVQVEDVVVVAYGTRKKGTVTGSVSVVSADKLENLPVANFGQALQGQVAGLQVMANSGEPSAPMSFSIRGVNSINAGTEPLFIIDGIPVSAADFSAINPNDIESQTVLKDAASTAIYGARAANGVIVITTKRGKMGDKSKVTLRTQTGFSNLAYGKWNLMNSSERLTYEEEIGLRLPGTYDREILERTNIDWRDVVYNNNAPLQNIDLSISGASDKINYYTSASYFKQEGISLGSDYERMAARANLEAKANNWLKVGTNISLSYEKFSRAVEGGYYTNTPISASRFMLPYWNPYRSDGSTASVADGSWIGVGENPIEWHENNPEWRNKTKVIASGFAELNPLKGLFIRSTAGIDAMDYRSTIKSNPSYIPNYGSGSVSEAFRRYANWNISNTANYRFQPADDHTLNVMVGQEATQYDNNHFNVTSGNQTHDKLLTLGYGTMAQGWNSGLTRSTFLSFFGRAEYNYLQKYYVDFSIRRDGSSKFGKDSKWANFWSVGLMWDLKSEPFMQSFDWWNSAQLSASVGTSGNSSIPDYYHLALVSGGPQYGGLPGIAPSTKGQDDLTWEKLFSANFGLKNSFFNNRLNAGVEAYYKHTSDMLMEVPSSLVEGYKMRWANVGAMVNKGFELDLNADIIRYNGLVWNVGTTLSYNHNEIVELYNGLDEYEMANTGTFLKVGHSVGEFYVNRFAGVNPANGDALWYDKEGGITNVFNPNDKVLVGKSYFAPWQGGINTSLSYKGFTMSAMFSWVADRYMMNNDRFFDESNGQFASYNQSSALLYDRWKQPGDIASIPRHGVDMQFDDRLLENASFLRLKNLTFSYNFPDKILQRTKFLDGARVYAQGQNLFTATSFQGMDPESTSNIYAAQYPLSRQFTFGIEISF